MLARSLSTWHSQNRLKGAWSRGRENAFLNSGCKTSFKFLIDEEGPASCVRCHPWAGGPGICHSAGWERQKELPSLTSASSAPASRFLPSLLWWWTLTWNFEWRNLGIHLVYAPMCIHVWWFPGVHTYVNTCVMIPLCTHLYVYMCDDYPVYTCVTITRVQPMYIHVCDNCPVCTPMCIYVCDDYLVYSYV